MFLRTRKAEIAEKERQADYARAVFQQVRTTFSRGIVNQPGGEHLEPILDFFRDIHRYCQRIYISEFNKLLKKSGIAKPEKERMEWILLSIIGGLLNEMSLAVCCDEIAASVFSEFLLRGIQRNTEMIGFTGFEGKNRGGHVTVVLNRDRFSKVEQPKTWVEGEEEFTVVDPWLNDDIPIFNQTNAPEKKELHQKELKATKGKIAVAAYKNLSPAEWKQVLEKLGSVKSHLDEHVLQKFIDQNAVGASFNAKELLLQIQCQFDKRIQRITTDCLNQPDAISSPPDRAPVICDNYFAQPSLPAGAKFPFSDSTKTTSLPAQNNQVRKTPNRYRYIF